MSEDPRYPEAPQRPSAHGGAHGARPTSAMAIVALVLGILALLTSFVPIVNNGSFFLALLGAVFAVIGLVGVCRGKKAGKGIAIAALVLNVVSIVVVLVTQSAYSAAIDSASKSLEGPGVASTSASAGLDAQNAQSASDATQQTTQLAVGTSVTLENGLAVSADEVTTGLANYDGSPMVGVRVTYVNGSDAQVSFNAYDWKAQDAQGAQRSESYYSGATDSLDSGTLAPGGSVSGTVYFDGDVVELLYYGSVFSSAPTASWSLA